MVHEPEAAVVMAKIQHIEIGMIHVAALPNFCFRSLVWYKELHEVRKFLNVATAVLGERNKAFAFSSFPIFVVTTAASALLIWSHTFEVSSPSGTCAQRWYQILPL